MHCTLCGVRVGVARCALDFIVLVCLRCTCMTCMKETFSTHAPNNTHRLQFSKLKPPECALRASIAGSISNRVVETSKVVILHKDKQLVGRHGRIQRVSEDRARSCVSRIFLDSTQRRNASVTVAPKRGLLSPFLSFFSLSG